MAGMKLSSMGLDSSIAHVFTARNILTAKDALCKTQLELVELLDVPFEAVSSAVAVISEKVCPPVHTVLHILKERARKESGMGHLPTGLRALDDALWGGIPFGVMTEVVGPAGIGKTQLCLLLSVLTAVPENLGGLNGSVIYVDTENKFRSGRLIQIAQSRFPTIYNTDEMVEKLAARVLVVQPTSVAELMLRLQGLEEAVIEHGVRLIIIDSVAALVQSEYGRDRIIQRQEMLGRKAAILKYLAESYRMPVIVTNQVRYQSGPGGNETTFPFAERREILLTAEAANKEGLELQLTAALGTKWAHSVNIRLVLESLSGDRYIKIAKSPMSATLAFAYVITAGGIQQKGDEIYDASDGGRNLILPSGEKVRESYGGSGFLTGAAASGNVVFCTKQCCGTTITATGAAGQFSSSSSSSSSIPGGSGWSSKCLRGNPDTRCTSGRPGSLQVFAVIQQGSVFVQNDEDERLRELAAREEEAAALAAEAESLLRLEKQAILAFGNDKQAVIDAEARLFVQTHARNPVVFERGEGCKLYDTDGKEYLDLAAGIAVNLLGHADPMWLKAVYEQAESLAHVSNLYHTVPQVRVAERLVNSCFADRVFFANSGTEANEAAIKFSCKYQTVVAKKIGDSRWFKLGEMPVASELVSFTSGFHGRTLGSLSLTSKAQYRAPFEALMPGVNFVQFGDLEATAKVVRRGRTAAVFVEPTQGEGGVHTATAEFLRGLRSLCDKAGALLVFDEVQCGLGRTGLLWAHEAYGVQPDIMTLAKPLAGGLPIGAVLVTEAVASTIAAGDHGSTFAGGPLVCHAALAVLDRIQAPGFLETVANKGHYLCTRLQDKIGSNHHVKEIRGIGLLVGIELDVAAAPLINAALNAGLLILSAGKGNVVRLAPPLTISEKELNAAVEILAHCMPSLD